MKFVNELLYLEFSELVACGVSENTIFQAKRRNSSSWNFINDPDDRRKVLIGYEKLSDNYKEQVQKRFGNPYDYIAKQPIRDLLQKDFNAEEFYLKHRYNGNTPLPIEHVYKYTNAASWLNLLLKLNTDKKFIKKTLNLSLDKFYETVCEIISQDKIDLPTSYRRLRAKMDEYKAEGYQCLIDWRFGNKLAAKIGKVEGEFNEEIAAKQTAIIRKAASLHNNFDAVQITRAVNIIFEKNGWQTVSDGTVKNIIAKYEYITTPGARGKRVYDSTIAMQVKREAPKYPLLHCTLDGWTVELLYQDEKGYNNRLVMVVVLDSCKKYPLGFAIGDRENSELIKQACRNAIIHLQEIFGKPYYPLQLQSDHYALKKLTPFYEAMAHIHTPAAVGNAKSKIIEPYFKYLNKHYCQKFQNWSGFNITSKKENQPNAEFLNQIKTTFPTKEGVMKQIEMIMQQERRLKFGEYRDQFNGAPAEIKKELSEESYLMVFGKPHTHTNQITGQGIIATLLGQQLTYDSFEPEFRANQHLKWQLIYDETNLSKVLAVSEDGKLRFILDKKRAVPMDIYSTTDEDRSYLKQIRDFNKQRKEEIIQSYISDDAITQEVLENTPLALNDFDESVLKLMFTSKTGQQKEAIQDAKHLIEKKIGKPKREKVLVNKSEQNNWNAQQLQYLQSKTDFNQYLD